MLSDLKVSCENAEMVKAVEDCPRLERHEQGRQAFVAMLRAWRARSCLSLQDLAELCEIAMRTDLAPGVPRWVPRPYSQGELVVANGGIWRVKYLIPAPEDAPQRGETEHQGPFELVTTVRRLFTSQLHSLERGKAQTVGSQVFDTLGTLNLWLADLRRGKGLPPEEAKLAEKALQATVLEDSDGPFGPEEMFSVYVGRMQPPFSVTQLTAEQANEQSRLLARKIRKGMAESGLDLVDDWSLFVAVYPTSDSTRLAKVRDVALGRSTWSSEQVEDEAAAAEIALAKLTRGLVRTATEENR